MTATAYFATNLTPLGSSGTSDGIQSYSIFDGVPNMPSSVSVGDKGTIGTQRVYTNSTKVTLVMTVVQTYVVEVDTPTTAIVNLIATSTDPSGKLIGTEQDKYRIDASGELSPITVDVQNSNGTHLVFTYNAHTLASLSINPPSSSVVKGRTTSFTVKGGYSDGTEGAVTTPLAWTTADSGTATIDSITGIASGVGMGSTKVYVSSGAITSVPANLLVTAAEITEISVSPISLSTPKGIPAAITATATYTDGSTGDVSGSVTWASSNAVVAAINASGIASAMSEGSTTVSASTNGISSKGITLTVTQPILASLLIASESVELGYTKQLAAFGTLSDGFPATLGPLNWTSSNNAVATIDGSGLANGLAVGSSDVTASIGNIVSNIAALNVTPIPAPSGTSAISSPGQITLSWSHVSGATSYNIYWGTSAGVSIGSNKITAATSPYVHNNLTDGMVYYYRVSAVNSFNETLSDEFFSILYAGGNPSGVFNVTGSLIAARQSHTATLLPNGEVLVAGGTGSTGKLASAEIYDPTTGSFSSTGSMTVPRSSHTATLLRNGKVLLIGGGPFITSAELFDPQTGTFTSTAGVMAVGRERHTATLLNSGKVLVTGGYGSGTYSGYHSTAELFDPATGTFTAVGNTLGARCNHTATLLLDGKVLLTGGTGSSLFGSAEIFDPATNSFALTGYLARPKYAHTATLLPDGKVLVMGGLVISGFNYASISEVELFDPATGLFTLSFNPIQTARHTAVRLSNGQVLVSGGVRIANSGGTTTSTQQNNSEIYDPTQVSYAATSSMNLGRSMHTATLLINGNILVTGGVPSGASDTNSAELFQ